MSEAPRLALHVFSTFGVGGPQVRFVAIAKRFGGAYRHLVLAMDDDYGCATLLPSSIGVSYPLIRTCKGATLRNAWRFRRILHDLRPDVLLTYNWGAIEWALANLLPVARHVHIEDGFGPEEREVEIRRRVLARRILLRRTVTVLPSRNLWRIATQSWRLDPKWLRYVPNGIDVRRFAPARIGSPRARAVPVVGTVAALRAEKNIARLIRAFRLLDEPARLIIAGEGPARPELMALAGQLGLADRIVFAGHVHEPAELYRGFDVFALSSDTEQMPLCVLEAMATGLPIAATDVGDIRDMVAPCNQHSLAVRDDAALAHAIRALLRAPDRGRGIGAANRAKAERAYDEEIMFGSAAALLNGTSRPMSEP